MLAARFSWLRKLLEIEYGIDGLYRLFFVKPVTKLSCFFYYITDKKIIDDGMVNNSGRGVQVFSKCLRLLQTGYLNHYVLLMLLSLIALLIWGSIEIGF